MDFEFLREVVLPAQTKIAMIIMDGLGGLPLEPGGKTELESACTPNLNALAAQSALGLTMPLGPGITVESGPGHLAIFGYDPVQYRIGRGVLEAVGIHFELEPGDVAARGNFCSVDSAGLVTDRRAGRIATDASEKLAKLVSTRIGDVDLFVETVREHRLAIILRGPGLDSALTGSDPLKNGMPPQPVRARCPASEKTACVVNEFIARSHQILADKQPANMILVRGFDSHPNLPSFSEVYGLRAAAIAVYPTYRGIAELVGMEILQVEGSTIADEFAALERNWNDFDFFYLHIKQTDLAGEDGDFERKARAIEEVDALIPRLMELEPDVVIVGGDHSTPAALQAHSWHPVPVLLHSNCVRPDGVREFGERACARGSLGVLPAKDIMPLALANARRIEKFSS
jgi:2,3-bisphosphoglycerate-independent phosphoglycerate mutase